MKTQLTGIEKITEFPCLMEFKLQGEVPVGIYLVNEYPETTEPSRKYSVCMILPIESNLTDLGNVYFMEELNPEEWFFLPAGTSVNLIN